MGCGWVTTWVTMARPAMAVCPRFQTLSEDSVANQPSDSDITVALACKARTLSAALAP